MPKRRANGEGKHPQTKGRTLGRTLHSRSRSGNWQGHHQECAGQDASGSKRETEKGHRGKRGNRLRQSENLHRGNMAGGLAGELCESKTQTVHVQDQPRFSKKPHQAADRQHPAGRSRFSGLAAILQAPAGRRASRPHRSQEKAERSGSQDGAKYPPDDRLGIQPRYRAEVGDAKIQHRAVPCQRWNTKR